MNNELINSMLFSNSFWHFLDHTHKNVSHFYNKKYMKKNATIYIFQMSLYFYGVKHLFYDEAFILNSLTKSDEHLSFKFAQMHLNLSQW